jgi:hypothetical protein
MTSVQFCLSVSLPSLSLSSFSLFRDEQPPAGFISDLDNDHFSVDAADGNKC